MQRKQTGKNKGTILPLLLILILAAVLVSATAEDTVSEDSRIVILPQGTTRIESEAFAGNTAIRELVIPEAVQWIGQNAFNGCSGLETVTFLNPETLITPGAFAGCSDGLKFNVYQGSTAELFAYMSGFSQVSYLGDQNPIYNRLKAMIGQYDATGSTLQGKESRRVIVRVSGDHLPDLTAYEPVSIIRRNENIFFIQLPNVDKTVACYEALQARIGTDVVYAEYDESTSVIDNEVSGAGIVSWGTGDDPMGFDTYAQYVSPIQYRLPIIAVVDSGINSNGSYASRLSSESINMINDGQGSFYDGCRHGSIIASIISDCVGPSQVGIMSVRVVNNRNQTTPSLLGMGIAYAAEHGASIINLSLNTSESEYVKDEIREAMKHCHIVVAAGNDRLNTSKVFPTNVSGTIVVSGLQDAETIWHESNTGSQVMFSAPAVGLQTHDYLSIPAGTSFSAPMISAAYALVESDPTHKVDDMINSCVDLGTSGRDSAYGYGMPDLNVLAALKVTRIEVEDAPEIMLVGDSMDLSYMVYPERALNKTITCTSSNESVLGITRTEEGGVTLRALASGHATVTLTANDGSGVSTSFETTVVQEVKSITIRTESDELPMTRTMALSVLVEPATADQKMVLWSSSNPAVATVSDTGVVTPHSVGETVIRAEATDGYGAADELALTVIMIPDAQSVSLIVEGRNLLQNEDLTIKPGDTVQIGAQVYPHDADQTVVWSIRGYPENAATIDQTGKLTALQSGTVFVTATTANNCRADLVTIIMVMPTNVVMSGENIVTVGTTITLTAEMTPYNVSDKKINWYSSDESVATVDQEGQIRGISGGEATIFARANADESIQASKLITVRQMPSSIQILGNTEIYIGKHSQLTAQVIPANTYDTSVIWTSSDPEIATVSENGLVTALSRGSVTITAKSNADGSVAEMVTVLTETEWTEWTAWTTIEATATEDMQVEDRIEYSYQDTTYTGWSRWTEYSTSPINIPSGDNDIMRVDTASIYGWYYFLCPHCQNHNRFWGSNRCSNCGKTVPQDGWHAYNTNQPWNAAGQSYTESYYGYGLLWSWSDGNGLQGATGYRKQTRSRIIGEWSTWSPNAVTEFSTADRIRKVRTRTTWRRRYHSTFDEKVISDWVPENEAPVNAVVVNSKWKYTEHTSSTSETLEGWTQMPGGGWKQISSGTVRSANFSPYPTFDTGNALYRAYNVTPPTAYETATTKRTVSSGNDGYIYWHYMYSVSANAYDRVIFYSTGYGNGPVSQKYYYRYFQAHESRTAYNKTQANDGQNTTLYSWYVNTSDHQSNAESGGSWYWYRIPITKTTYTDYVKNYDYTRERETTEAPQVSENITDVVRYVQYFLAGEG